MFSASVESELTRQRSQSLPVHASQASGGCSGCTPTPSTCASTSTRTTQRGTASFRPTSKISSTIGTSENAANGLAIFSPSVRSWDVSSS